MSVDDMQRWALSIRLGEIKRELSALEDVRPIWRERLRRLFRWRAYRRYRAWRRREQLVMLPRERIALLKKQAE